MPSLRFSRQRANVEGQMPLVDHIRELRSRLLKAVIALTLGTVAGFVFFETVWEVAKQPYCQLEIAQQGDNPCKLVVTGIFEAFFLRLRLALILGALMSCPVWLYQLWAFIAPGLHQNERRYTYIFLGFSIPLFLGGGALAYVTLNKGLQILLSFVPAGVDPLIRVSEYLTYATAMVFIFGISFELPLLVTVLNLAGALSYERLKRWRRWIVFGVCVFAAVATPSQDPITMLALAIPMVVLMEIATLIARIHDRRQAASTYDGIADDEASPLDLDDSGDFDRESR